VTVARLQRETLDLSGKGLTEVPESTLENASLRVLNLHRNRLIAIPSEIGRLEGLEVLILAENALTSLSEEIGRLTNLRTLDLGHNRLENLPRTFSKLKGLRDYLYLHDNRLTALDDGVFEGFGELRYLNLSGNAGLRLPGSIAKLNKLEELRLEHLGLGTVPNWIGSLASLEELSLRDGKYNILVFRGGDYKML